MRMIKQAPNFALYHVSFVTPIKFPSQVKSKNHDQNTSCFKEGQHVAFIPCLMATLMQLMPPLEMHMLITTFQIPFT